MIQNRAVWLSTLFNPGMEGDKISVRPPADDPGGISKYGVTKKGLADWKHVDVATIGDDDIRNLTLLQAKALALGGYWNPCRCDSMVGGADIYLADTAYLSGPRRAVKLLQKTLDFAEKDIDGYIGPMTLEAATQLPPRVLVLTFHDVRIKFLRTLPNYPANPGWEPRCKAMRDLALSACPPEPPAAVAAQSSRHRWVATAVSTLGTTVLATLPAAIEAIPAAKAAYNQTTDLATPFDSVVPGISLALGALVIAGVIWMKVHSSRMADKSAAAGSTAVTA